MRARALRNQSASAFYAALHKQAAGSPRQQTFFADSSKGWYRMSTNSFSRNSAAGSELTGKVKIALSAAAILAVTMAGTHLWKVQAQGVPVSNPPTGQIQILAFPQRDFISASGFA